MDILTGSLTFFWTSSVVIAYWIGKLAERGQAAELEEIREAIEKLPGRQPEILALRSEGYSYLEISAKIGMDKDEVLTEMAKGFASLRMQQMPIGKHYPTRGRIFRFIARYVLSRM